MSPSIKVMQKAAFKLERGITGVGQSLGWGQLASEQTLAAQDAFPYLSLGKGVSSNSVSDDSITSQAFKSIPVQVTKHVEKSFERNVYFNALNNQLFWMWGWQNNPISVVCFVAGTVTDEPVAGDVYEDVDLNEFTFLRKEVTRLRTLYIFSGTTAPTLQAGDLSDTELVSPKADLPFTAHSGLKYETIFELDSLNRHYTAYTTPEQITGWLSGDKKNRMATIAVKMATLDFLYKNAMCKSFNIKSAAAGLLTLGCDFLAYDELRADYDSDDWTYPSGVAGGSNLAVHSDIRFEVGVDEDNLVALGITDWSTQVDIPLQVLQDTTTGIQIAEPVLEGDYGVALTAVLSRYSSDLFQQYRDDWTKVVARVSGTKGYNMWETLYQEAIVPEAGPDEGEVASEPLSFQVGVEVNQNNWSNWLHGNTLRQNGSVLMRVRGDDSTNYLFAFRA